jgi:hypothetical protein
MQLLLVESAGLIGIMLATPLAATAIAIVRRLWIEDVLERRPSEPPVSPSRGLRLQHAAQERSQRRHAEGSYQRP